ncbi:MAG: T9SS type A sorting domain-containing protein [Bacteroidia bacterium]
MQQTYKFTDIQNLNNTPFRFSLLVVFLLLAGTMISTSAFAVVKTSKGTGDWTDPNNWNPIGVPVAADDVTIASGHIVTMPSVGVALTECNNLTIQAGATMILLSRDHTTHGTTTVNGSLLDTQNSGANIFIGKVTVGASGSWNTSGISNVNNLVFRGGLENNGVSFIINKATFNTNNQTISGTSAISFPGTVIVGAGIELTNNNIAGLSFGPIANLNGVDAASKFINQTTMTYKHKNAPMLIGLVDFSPVGNTVIYNRDGVKQAVLGTTYYNLVIGPDPLLSNFDHEATANIVVLNDFTVQNGAEFLVKGFDLAVTGNTLIQGLFTDADLLGTTTLANVELSSGGYIDGNNASHGTININGNLSVPAGTGQIDEGVVTVTGTTSISAGATLLIGSQFGTKTFGQVDIAATGKWEFLVNNAATVATFTGAVNNNGTFTAQKGTYTFQGIFNNTATGIFNVNAAGLLTLETHFVNNGTANFPAGAFTFHNSTISGSSPLVFNGDITVGAGFMTTNSNTGGITLNAVLNGTDGASNFRNEQSFTYNPTLRNIPMATGILTASTVGNTFRYSRVGSDQDVKGTTYHNLVFENGTVRTLNNGNVVVNGNLTNTISQVGAGIITIAGGGPQVLSGGGTFLNLTVNKPTEALTLTSDITVTNALTISSGLVITGLNIIHLSTTGTLSETPTAYIFGLVEAERTLGGGSTSTFGNIGLDITSSAGNPLGLTLVGRSTATPVLTGGINRAFLVVPTNNAALNASITFKYLDADIIGLVEGNFVLLHNTGGGFVNIGGTLNAGLNQMTVSGINSFGGITVGDPASFPVEWLDFQAVNDPMGVVLSWSTAFELNNDYFLVERSVDGNLFSAIGKVEGSGTTSDISTYTFNDHEALNLNSNVFYYRLKQVDLNGQFDYSNIVEIRLESTVSLELKAFPSPFTDELTIQLFQNDLAANSTLKLVDMAGKLIWSQNVGHDSGTYDFSVPTAGLSSGIYTVMVQSGNTVKYVRVVK